ncbi:hypothetical protein Cs7R123_29760 [Catellatospora sp. TT07R-123]|nr:hypothetical protein Cs7R123_29760 [Catellatospora sp. TT07R-123]
MWQGHSAAQIAHFHCGRIGVCKDIEPPCGVELGAEGRLASWEMRWAPFRQLTGPRVRPGPMSYCLNLESVEAKRKTYYVKPT